MQDIAALEAHLRDLDREGDWASWLVYADHLRDQGDTRCEAIELEYRLSGALCPEERGELQRQVEAAVVAHREEWLGGWSCPASLALEWRKGFVWEARFREVGDLQRSLAALEALVEQPAGRFLTGLGFSATRLNDEGAALLACSRALRPVRRLKLFLTALGSDGALALARSPHLGALTALDASCTRLGDEGAVALAGSPTPRALTTLRLGHIGLSARGAATLAQSELLRSVTRLDLAGNCIGAEGAAALARSPVLGALASLDLRQCRLDDEAAVALAASRTLSSLTELFLGDNDIRDEGRAALARSTALRCRIHWESSEG